MTFILILNVCLRYWQINEVIVCFDWFDSSQPFCLWVWLSSYYALFYVVDSTCGYLVACVICGLWLEHYCCLGHCLAKAWALMVQKEPIFCPEVGLLGTGRHWKGSDFKPHCCPKAMLLCPLIFHCRSLSVCLEWGIYYFWIFFFQILFDELQHIFRWKISIYFSLILMFMKNKFYTL